MINDESVLPYQEIAAILGITCLLETFPQNKLMGTKLFRGIQKLKFPSLIGMLLQTTTGDRFTWYLSFYVWEDGD